jgi:Flp pilus assembly protein TadG
VNREAGATMVEFALVAVVAFILLFGLAEVGLIVFGNSIGSNAARDGARVGIINYEDADVPGSPNNLAILASVQQRLVGMVTFESAAVSCRPGDDSTLTVPCRSSAVDLTRGDLLEVTVQWKHRGAAAFVPATHSATARMVINGAPDLSTTATTAPATSTTTGPTTTTTAPGLKTVVAAQTADADNDGRIDKVLVTFSGALEPSCADGWTLGEVPSGGTLAGVTISGSVATLAISEGTGPPDTAVGPFTVTFAGCAGTSAFVRTPSDGAGPVFTSLSDGGGTDGRPEPGDTLDLRFSEPLSPTWGTSLVVPVTLERSGNHDVDLSVPSLVSGNTISTGSPGYVAKNQSVAFNNSTLSVFGSTLRLTLGSACVGCPHAGVGQGSFTFTPAGTIRDAAGYISIAPVTATNLKLF